MEQFVSNKDNVKEKDNEYLDWLEKNPKGFVVNNDPKQRKAYLILHHSTCYTINKSEKNKDKKWMEKYMKTCSNDLGELQAYFKKLFGGDLHKCSKCYR
ncbi:MAG: hypothetical protein HQL01_11200 [Nitrospirae bacterium]|nr:hypothetical protein [Nitrospirota bacterium]